mmetsp:Transcript_28638/g.91339  ORF Transcript_28638/g.91339 Transcript_28638/m.91339 type:complete len:451 (-) Transcript_28638:375-1727(-)
MAAQLAGPQRPGAAGGGRGVGGVPLCGGPVGVRAVDEPGQRAAARAHHLLQGGGRRGGGGLPAVVPGQLQRDAPGLRQLHPHGGRRDAHRRLQVLAHEDAQQAGSQAQRGQGGGPAAERGALPGGPQGGGERQGPRARVRGADQDAPRQPRGAQTGGRGGERGGGGGVGAQPRGHGGRAAQGHGGDEGGRGGQEGARARAQEERAAHCHAAGQAERLLRRRGPRGAGDLPGGGGLGGGQRQAGAGSSLPGHPPAAGEDPQRRTARRLHDLQEPGDRQPHPCARPRAQGRGVRRLLPALPQDRDPHRRGRGWGAHPHSPADLPLPVPARALRPWARLRGGSAALQGGVRGRLPLLLRRGGAGAAPPDAERRQVQHPALQGPGRDDAAAAVGDHPRPRTPPHAPPHHGRRGGVGQHGEHAHGGQGGAPQAAHRGGGRAPAAPGPRLVGPKAD